MRRLGMLNTSKKQRTPILICPSSKKDVKKSLTQEKKTAAKKVTEVHDTVNNAKDQVERENAAAAAEAETIFLEVVAQEIERRSMQRSSTVANQREGSSLA